MEVWLRFDPDELIASLEDEFGNEIDDLEIETDGPAFLIGPIPLAEEDN